MSNKLTLYVNTIPIDTATYKMFDIKGPIQYPYTFKELLPWLLAGLAALLLVALGIYLWIRYKKNQPIFFKPKKADPPYVVAMRELKKLKEEKAWQQEHAKQYYTRLTDIFRIYVEKGFDLQTMEKTSQEILQDYKQSKLAKKYPLQKLSELFTVSDLAKFAKYQPTIDENERSFLIVNEFVEATKPDESPEDTKKEDVILEETSDNIADQEKQPEQE